MKSKLSFFVLMSFFLTNAQTNIGITGTTNWFSGWTNFIPKKTNYPYTNQVLYGDISADKTLTRDKIYLLKGNVRVINNATLTIEPGVIIRGDYDTTGTLIITKGSKIMAEGLENSPIVFTSNKEVSQRKPGDWGGIILMGDAPLNRFGGSVASFYDSNPLHNSFGGTNEDSNAGNMKYVRIEFAGKKINPKVALNGLTLAAVGIKTKIENIQISFAGDDSFEAVGGVVNLEKVISYRASDDDFDYSMGVITTLSNSIAIRNPYSSDNTRSRCLEIDSYDKIENYDPSKSKTHITLENVTLLNDEENNLGLIKEAISIKKDAFININNSVITGFTSFIALDEKYLTNNNYKEIKIKNTIVDNCTELITNEELVNDPIASNWFLKNNKTLFVRKITFQNLFKNNNIKKPDFRLK